MAIELVGRTREAEELISLVRSIRARAGHAVVLLGEPGVGKSALLDLAADLGWEEADFRVLRLAGAEAESGMSYGFLDRLLHELGSRDVALTPWPSAGADDDANVTDRRVLCETVLQAILGHAREAMLLLLVDDVHWVDQESQDVLAYVRRRLRGASVGIVLAGRELQCRDLEDHLVHVSPLAREEAERLFRSRCRRTFDAAALEQVLRAGAGNPAAICDLADSLSASDMRYDQVAVDPPPLAVYTTEPWLRGCGALSETALTWLLLAASEPTGQLRTIEAAARTIGLPRDACLEVEDAGIVELRDRIVFDHPLVAASVIATARAPRRRTAHQALARAAEDERSAVRAAWHVARSTTVPDDDASELLMQVCARFDHGMTYVTRAELLARSAELSSDEALRSTRLLGAAGHARLAGAHRMADELTAAATCHEPPPGDLASMSDDDIGGSEFLHGDLRELDLDKQAQPAVARTRHNATRAVVRAFTAWRSESFSDARPCMQQAIDVLLDADDDTTVHLYPYGVLLASATWDASALHRLLRNAQRVAEVRQADGVRTTVRDLTRAVECAVGRGPAVDLAPVAPLASVPAAGSAPIAEKWSAHIRILGLVAANRYREVLDATVGLEDSLPGRAGQLLPEIIEAGAHVGAAEVSQEALRSFERVSRCCPTPWTRGLLARSRALTSAVGAEDLFREAIAELSLIDASTQLARTHLLYGEWLRRNRRRRDAADQLRDAHTLLAEVQHPLLERAVRELSLAGATVNEGGAERLTAQELAVARLAAAGARNAEIAERLFISRHTVDYHLRKVYRKLKIDNRRGLPRAVSGL